MKPSAKIVNRHHPSDGTSLYVEVVWDAEVNRKSTGGWTFNRNQLRLAQRLTDAINAGVVYKNPKVLIDIYGETYVSADTTEFFHARHMNKSLEAVGF